MNQQQHTTTSETISNTPAVPKLEAYDVRVRVWTDYTTTILAESAEEAVTTAARKLDDEGVDCYPYRWEAADEGFDDPHVIDSSKRL